MAIENPPGWRIAKEKARKKIDAIVALSMARVAAVEAKPKVVDAHAVPISIPGGIGYELQRMGFSTFDQCGPFTK